MLCLCRSCMDALSALWLLVDGEASVLETLIYAYHVMASMSQWHLPCARHQIVVAVAICRVVVVVVVVVIVLVLVGLWLCHMHVGGGGVGQHWRFWHHCLVKLTGKRL